MNKNYIKKKKLKKKLMKEKPFFGVSIAVFFFGLQSLFLNLSLTVGGGAKYKKLKKKLKKN